MTAPTTAHGNFDGERFESDHPMDDRLLIHAAALLVYGANPMAFSIDSTVNVRTDNPHEGAGATTVRKVLEWVRADKGRAALRLEPPSVFQYLEKVADDLLGV